MVVDIMTCRMDMEFACDDGRIYGSSKKLRSELRIIGGKMDVFLSPIKALLRRSGIDAEVGGKIVFECEPTSGGEVASLSICVNYNEDNQLLDIDSSIQAVEKAVLELLQNTSEILEVSSGYASEGRHHRLSSDPKDEGSEDYVIYSPSQEAINVSEKLLRTATPTPCVEVVVSDGSVMRLDLSTANMGATKQVGSTIDVVAEIDQVSDSDQIAVFRPENLGRKEKIKVQFSAEDRDRLIKMQLKRNIIKASVIHTSVAVGCKDTNLYQLQSFSILEQSLI